MNLPVRLAMFASGAGTTAARVFQESTQGSLKGLIDPVCLVVSRADVKAIEHLISLGWDKDCIFVINPRAYSSSKMFGQAILEVLGKQNIDWFGQYGWLPKTPENVVQGYPGINQHPGPVPEFGGEGMYGLAVHEAVIRFCRLVKRPICTEATAHLVATEYDQGGVIFSRRLPVRPSDTAEELRQRLLPIEHRVQIEALKKVAQSNGLPEFVQRRVPLVYGHEFPALHKAKAAAREAYPHG